MQKRVLTRRGVPVVALGLAAALTFVGSGSSTFAEDAKNGVESVSYTIPSLVSITTGPTSETAQSSLQSLISVGSWVYSGPTSESTVVNGVVETAPMLVGASVGSSGLSSESAPSLPARVPVTINSAYPGASAGVSASRFLSSAGFASSAQVRVAAVTSQQSDDDLDQVGLGAVGVAIGGGPETESEATTVEQVGLGAVGVAVGGGPSVEAEGSVVQQIGLGSVGSVVGSGPTGEAAGTSIEQVGLGVSGSSVSGGPATESGGGEQPEQLNPFNPFGLSISEVEG